MAYKIQIGDAIYSGSITQVSGNLDASSPANDVSGSEMFTSGNVDLGGDLTITQGGIALQSANDVDHQFKILNGANTAVLIANTAGASTRAKGAQLEISTGAGSLRAEMGCAADGTKPGSQAGAAYVSLKDGAGDVFTIAGQSGDVSGSSDLDVGGSVVLVGNLTVGGNLTVDGTNITLETARANISAISASIASDHSLEADISGSEVITQAGGLIIRYPGAAADNSDSTTVKRIKILDGTNVGELSAPKFFGDGSNLTGFTATSFSYTVASKANGDTLVEGVNHVPNNASAVSLTLPACADGAVVYVKSFDAATSVANYIQISRAGSDTIEGSADAIRIQAPFGSVKLIGDGSNWHLA